MDGRVCVNEEDGIADGVEMFDAVEQAGGTPAYREEDEPRLRRIADFESVALAKENPFEAVMEAASAGLMRIEMRLQQAIEQAMTTAPVTPERVRSLAPSFDVHLKYARQIDRFGQIVRRLTTSSQAAELQNGQPIGLEEESEETTS